MTMLEQAVRALYAALKSHKRYVGPFQDDFLPDTDDEIRGTMIDGQFDLHAVGRAALSAIRQPDMELVRRVAREIGTSDATVDLCWVRMIDAILAERQ